MTPQSVGRPKSDVKMLRIDELADLGCCCFCSICIIASETFLAERPDDAAAFVSFSSMSRVVPHRASLHVYTQMRAVHKASVYLKQNPAQAWTDFKDFKKEMRDPVQAKIFERSLVYMSVDNYNV